MKFTVITIFPEMFESVLGASILGKARERGLVEVEIVDPREFTSDRHRTVDDAPYGGGPGMVMKPEPLTQALQAATERGRERGWPSPHRVAMSASGRPLSHRRVRELAEHPHIALLCGRYEGIDQRVLDESIDEELSIGDFVITGGELAAMTVIDAVSRFVDGVLGDSASADDESFSEGLLEYPHYTRPASFHGRDVPAVLTSGDHEAIRLWRREQALARTAERRPELLAATPLSGEDSELLQRSGRDWLRRTYAILAHHPVLDREGAVVTSSVTNMDLHDLARTVSTYGLAGYIVVTPVTSQRDKVERIVSTWRQESYIDNREQALGAVSTAASLADAYAAIEREHGASPVVVVTSAVRDAARPTTGFAELARQRVGDSRPTALVFGTGWGLSPEVVEAADVLLQPVSGRPEFNHLSVRSAAAIIIDRLFGIRGSRGRC